MASYVWVSSTNPANRYWTAVPNDPNVPAGYIFTGTSDGSAQIADGATDQNVRSQYVGGINSGGYPAYSGDTTQSGTANPNGILGG